MIDETTQRNERVGFCQDCGKPLTRETVRPVGSGVFCEPCLETRLGTNATSTATGSPYGAGPVSGQAGVPPNAAYVPIPAMPGEPRPLLAGFLGLIPGVGAMYNGQFAKGVAHLVIFAVLVSLASNVSSIFGIFVAGWIAYQAFEAYHTARARLEGLPLPNAFGFNDIGDRMGFGKNWPGSASRMHPAPPVVPVTPWTTQTAPPPVNPNSPMPPMPNWVGYVPPTEFGSTAAHNAAAASAAREQAYHDAGVRHPPYAETYTGATGFGPGMPMDVPARRFPTGAIWLIGLGVLFLANINSHFRIHGLWLVSIILAALAVWSFVRRMDWIGGADDVREHNARIICVLRGPVMLMLLAILFALQAADVWQLGQTWPALFIAFGIMLLLERSVGRPNHAMPMATPVSFVSPPPQGAGTATQNAVPASEPQAAQWAEPADITKGGQG